MNKKIYIYLGAAIILLVGAFLIGRKSVKPIIETKIEYLPGKPVHDTSYVDKPVYVTKYVAKKVDSLGLFRYLLDSHLYDYLLSERPSVDTSQTYVKVDTMAIIKDFLVRNDYKITLFDDNEKGKLVISPSVQYNKLLPAIPYEFTPIIKTVTNTNKVPIEPFVAGGFGWPFMVNVQAGMFTSNGFGFSGIYSRTFENQTNQYSLMIMYKF